MEKCAQKSLPILFCFLLILFGLSVTSFAQEKATLYGEIAGDYEYEYEGQVIIITYTVEDGILYATQEGDPNSPSRLDPVEGNELEFETMGGDGNLYVISFSRDGEGKITRSILSTMGIVIEGVKIKNKNGGSGWNRYK